MCDLSSLFWQSALLLGFEEILVHKPLPISCIYVSIFNVKVRYFQTLYLKFTCYVLCQSSFLEMKDLILSCSQVSNLVFVLKYLRNDVVDLV